jgi:hypothetical protein
VIVAAVLAYLWTRPEPVPRVSNYVQLTHDGQPKGLVGTDGLRLYVNLGNFDNQGIGLLVGLRVEQVFVVREMNSPTMKSPTGVDSL